MVAVRVELVQSSSNNYKLTSVHEKLIGQRSRGLHTVIVYDRFPGPHETNDEHVLKVRISGFFWSGGLFSYVAFADFLLGWSREGKICSLILTRRRICWRRSWKC